MEDLEEDRRLGPPEASEACDLLSMHGYPIYARWADGPTDDQLLPFLARVTHWLGEGRDVLFSEFGLPTYRGRSTARHAARPRPLRRRALEGLRRAGCLGALLWCYSDYDPALWENPPFDLAPHERTFGLWRADGSPKPAVAAIAAFVGAERCTAATRRRVDRHRPGRVPSRPACAAAPPLPPVSGAVASEAATSGMTD